MKLIYKKKKKKKNNIKKKKKKKQVKLANDKVNQNLIQASFLF